MTARIFIVDDEEHGPRAAGDAAVRHRCGMPARAGRPGERCRRGAARASSTTRPDILLLDIQMPGMNGLELAEQLAREGAGMPAVIFVSAHDDYALDAFDVHALDYLLKPVRAARLAAGDTARHRACANAAAPSACARPPRREHFSVHERDRLLLVPVADVLYLKAELKYVTLRTRTREYLIEDSLLSIEEELATTSSCGCIATPWCRARRSPASSAAYRRRPRRRKNAGRLAGDRQGYQRKTADLAQAVAGGEGAGALNKAPKGAEEATAFIHRRSSVAIRAASAP